MNLSFHIAKRYFFSRKGQGSFSLISVLSAISLLGYVVGAAALVVVLSVFNGFEVLFMSMYNNFDADLQISPAQGKTFHRNDIPLQRLQALSDIELYGFVLEENVLLKYDDRQNLATVKGVDENFATLTGLDSCIIAGSGILQQRDQNFAIVGQGVGYQLSIDPNDPFRGLQLFVPNRGTIDVLNPMDAFTKATLPPIGIFSVQEEVDNKYVIVPLAFLHELLKRPGEYSSIEIKLRENASQASVKKELQALLGEKFVVKNRFEQRDAFYKVMKSEKLISYFILFFILLIAAGNTIGTLYILVLEKKNDLVLLNAMGFSPNQARGIFTWQGIMMAVTGSAIGVLIGVVICWLQSTYGFVQLDNAASFMFNAYPVELRLTDVLIVFLTVVLLGLITAIYPAYKAKQLLDA